MTRIVLVLALAAGLPAFAQEIVPVHWRLADSHATVKPGAMLQARVVAEIDEQWHMYSLKQMEDGPIATTIVVAPGQPFTMDGEIEAPRPVSADDPNFGMKVEFYIGSAEFVLPVRVASGVKPGEHKLTIITRYQSCNERLCLPPRKTTLEMSVKVE